MEAANSALITNAVLEIRLQCTAAVADLLQELLWTLEGIEALTAHYQTEPTHDETQASDLTGVSVFTRLPHFDAMITNFLEANAEQLPGVSIESTRLLEEKDWAESWKQHWHPTPISDTLTICPTWETYAPKSPQETVILLDPECAFGTGTHETTQLMLKALEALGQELDFSQVNLLDVGTGSGILAIYAAKRGCRDVRGVDNDPMAVQTAQKNAVLNNVASFTDFTDTPLADLCRTQYDVILVNIIAPVILALWDEMLLRLNPSGRLIASGLIESSVGRVEAAMQAAGFTDIQQFRQGDWFALSGIAPASV